MAIFNSYVSIPEGNSLLLNMAIEFVYLAKTDEFPIEIL
jgi:hypothetical protein